MQPTSLHYFPLTWPYSIALFLLLAFLVALVEFNILVYAYVQMGVHPRYVTSLLLLSLLGASVNIPVAQLPEEKTVENQIVRYAGWALRSHRLAAQGRTTASSSPESWRSC